MPAPNHAGVRESPLECARLIYETIRLLRARIGARRAAALSTDKNGAPGHELTLAQVNALMVIQERGEVTITQLARALQVSAPSASTMADRLVEMGLVVREHGSTDRREVRVQIAPGAAAELEDAERQFLQVIVELLDRVGPDCARQWCEVYARIREVLLESGQTELESAG
ncbi:MAG: MarR family transcriptional regulator [Candidatus Hydrogenedentes bacterium]|nr:MarR family transcriptional regulator [Candidatus Hydrogenedentota bacterium]